MVSFVPYNQLYNTILKCIKYPKQEDYTTIMESEKAIEALYSNIDQSLKVVSKEVSDVKDIRLFLNDICNNCKIYIIEKQYYNITFIISKDHKSITYSFKKDCDDLKTFYSSDKSEDEDEDNNIEEYDSIFEINEEINKKNNNNIEVTKVLEKVIFGEEISDECNYADDEEEETM